MDVRQQLKQLFKKTNERFSEFVLNGLAIILLLHIIYNFYVTYVGYVFWIIIFLTIITSTIVIFLLWSIVLVLTIFYKIYAETLKKLFRRNRGHRKSRTTHR